MTALAANRKTPESDDRFVEEDVAASVHIYKGALVSLDTSGNLRPARVSTTDRCVGVATQERDNSSGGAGDLTCRVEAGVFAFENSAGGDEVVAADIGQACYVVDDQTVAKTSNSATRIAAGRVVRVENGLVYVAVGRIFGSDGDLVSTNNLSDVGDAATARANLGANVGCITRSGIPLDADGTFYIPAPPVGGTITELRTAVEGATTTTGAPDVALQIDGTPVTDGAVAIAIGTVVGEQDSATPSAANVFSDGENLEIDVTANSQDASATLSVTIEYTY